MADHSNKKREHIMMVMAALAVVYLLFAWMFPGGREVGAPAIDLPDETLLTTLSEEVDSLAGRPTDNISAILLRAGKPWRADAFVAQDYIEEDVVEDIAGPGAADTLIFSGYMIMGGNTLAIVNNRDYQIGDMIEGYTLLTITPSGIVLEKHGTRKTVPLQTPGDL